MQMRHVLIGGLTMLSLLSAVALAQADPRAGTSCTGEDCRALQERCAESGRAFYETAGRLPDGSIETVGWCAETRSGILTCDSVLSCDLLEALCIKNKGSFQEVSTGDSGSCKLPPPPERKNRDISCNGTTACGILKEFCLSSGYDFELTTLYGPNGGTHTSGNCRTDRPA